MTLCETSSDFMFPLTADVYYSSSKMTAYSTVQKTWVLNKNIKCSLSPASSGTNQNFKAVRTVYEQSELLSGRFKSDLRISSDDVESAFSEVIVTNIRDVNGNEIYVETSGPRANKSTIFEIANQSPFVNPFGDVEHYSVVLRRSENQGVDV